MNKKLLVINLFLKMDIIFVLIYIMKIIIYISEPKFETKIIQYVQNDNFTNIIIKNRIPLNLNIVGVIYYYKTLLNKTECKNQICF